MKTLAKPIQVVSWTEENGTIHPVRFKIATADGDREVYKVMRIHTMELDRIAGNKVYKFTCEVAINRFIKLCEIRYELESCRWMLFKI